MSFSNQITFKRKRSNKVIKCLNETRYCNGQMLLDFFLNHSMLFVYHLSTEADNCTP